MIRVVLADDQALVRAGFRVLLDSAGDIEVVGEAASGEEAVAQARDTRPDVVLMDIRMPNTDGLEATRRISADPGLAGVRVLILTTFEVDEYVFEALRSGASGFVVKDMEPAELLQGVLAGQPGIVHQRADESGADAGQTAAIFRLTLFPVLTQLQTSLQTLKGGTIWQHGFCWCCGSCGKRVRRPIGRAATGEGARHATCDAARGLS